VVTLEVPVPALVVLIGAAGSGKSTLAARLFPPDAILSSDALREAVSGDAANQRVSRVAFRLLHDQLGRRLAGGQLAVVDATNARSDQRLPLVRRAAAAGVPALAIALDLPAELVLARAAGRSTRVVARDVVERQLADVRRSLDGDALAGDGFRSIVVLRTPADVDALAVVLETAAT
jgi:protein phosphatase